MAPGFRDVTGCRQLGIAAEWRHTHVLDLRIPWRERYSPAVRQHLRAAESSVAFRREHVGAFRFDRALVAQSESQYHARRAFVARASAAGAVTCLAAVARGDVVGQALTLRVTDTSILLHSWFERRGPRGVPTLLVDAAADSGYRDGARWLDLEGSVLAGVDYFMSGFGGETVPYPHLYWHRNPLRHAELILAGIAAGRETDQ